MFAQDEQIPAYWFLIKSHVLRKRLKHRKWFLGNFKSVVEWKRTTNAIELHEPFPSAIDELGEDLFENKEAGKGNREKVSRDFRHKGIMTLCWLFTIFSRLILRWWQWRGNKKYSNNRVAISEMNSRTSCSNCLPVRCSLLKWPCS